MFVTNSHSISSFNEDKFGVVSFLIVLLTIFQVNNVCCLFFLTPLLMILFAENVYAWAKVSVPKAKGYPQEGQGRG